ncbi:MAG: formyltransferase family protein [Gammaproteobacteria bacterium]
MKQRYAFFTGSCLALPAIEYLAQTDQLACVVLVDAEPNPDLNQLVGYLQQRQLPLCRYERQEPHRLLTHLDGFQATSGFIYLYRHILCNDVIDYFQQRLYNLHPSALPDYRGPFPLYWQLRNGEMQVCLTLHQVTDQPDAGPIGSQLVLPVHPFDTLQSLSVKVSRAVPQLMQEFSVKRDESSVDWQPQSIKSDPALAPSIQQEDVVIHWQQQSSKQLVDLIRAGNPNLGGALLKTPKGCFNVLQATAVDNAVLGLRPGTILSLSLESGLVVKTLDGAIRLDVISTPEGIFDGYRFAVLFGVEPGLELNGQESRFG